MRYNKYLNTSLFASFFGKIAYTFYTAFLLLVYNTVNRGMQACFSLAGVVKKGGKSALPVFNNFC